MKKHEIFKTHPKLKEVHMTSDGEMFYKQDDAKLHARTLENKTVEIVINPDLVVKDAEVVSDEQSEADKAAKEAAKAEKAAADKAAKEAAKAEKAAADKAAKAAADKAKKTAEDEAKKTGATNPGGENEKGN